ncbi:hypothetical protein OEZ85_003330 [Tetradesmus obliquus]|uniref:PDZ domain-containing protein n=1 Tax=Tetradesmus obliquus TaxID=3088 RepID=A0ABY8UAY4_TETOB|nr:hypothetical protein OEZ85_003330 [Tetradesmus obliquus]
MSAGLGYLQQLSRLGAASAHASAVPYPDSRLLPTPWDQQGQPGSSSIAGPAAAAAGSNDGDAVLMRSSISAAAAAAGPAVVHLVAAGAARGPAAAAAAGLGPGWADGRAQGSGFIYDPRGFILTNAHVVLGTPPAAALAAATAATRWPQQQQQQQRHTSTSLRPQPASSSSSSSSNPSAAAAGGVSAGGLRVHLADGRVLPGRLVALDAASDLAVVAVDAPQPLPCARLGDSHRLRVGEWVVALGSPLLLRQSVTAGIVSAVARQGSELGLASPRTEFIQTDAAINVGNSGGPLVNLDGEVVGMNNMKAAAADGVSFAIPMHTIQELLSEIARHGRVLRPYVGITMAEVAASRMAQLREACPDFPPGVAAGIVVTRVAPGSPAAAAGLREDDVIVAAAAPGSAPGQLGGPAGLSVADLADALRDAIGGSLDLVVVREQRQQQQQVAGAAAAAQSGAGSSSRYVYVTLTVRPVEAPSS